MTEASNSTIPDMKVSGFRLRDGDLRWNGPALVICQDVFVPI